mmetsp:Transcript_42401/g.78946  ORF Transcript_42401/g.78946 Transcript_42401/m.78946 type:complete len:921 (-) Transcript_42401:91-2853(-)
MAFPGDHSLWPEQTHFPWVEQSHYPGLEHAQGPWTEPARPNGPLVSSNGEKLFQVGEQVFYLSRSSGQWIPAVVQGYNAVPGPHGPETSAIGSYRLDVKADADPMRVIARRDAGWSTPGEYHPGFAAATPGNGVVNSPTGAVTVPPTPAAFFGNMSNAPSSPLYDGGFAAGNPFAQNPVTPGGSLSVPGPGCPAQPSWMPTAHGAVGPGGSAQPSWMPTAHGAAGSFPVDGFPGLPDGSTAGAAPGGSAQPSWMPTAPGAVGSFAVDGFAGRPDGSTTGGAGFNPFMPQANLLPPGEAVFYLSRTSGQWVPATVQGHGKSLTSGELRYNLDVQPEAEPLRVIRRADFDVKFSANPPAQVSDNTRPVSANPPAQVRGPAGMVSSVDLAPDPLLAGFGPPVMDEASSQPSSQAKAIAFDGELQRGLGPEMWAMDLKQLEDVMDDPRCDDGMLSLWAPSKWTMREIVNRLIKPDTKGTGIGYAMLKNQDNPLKARIMVSHSWDAEYKDLVAALRDSRENGPYWICAMAMYQGEDALPNGGCKAGSDPGLGPFAYVLGKVDHLLCVLTSSCDIYKRLWCLFEISTAEQLRVPVKVSQKHRGQSWGIVHDPLLDLCRDPVCSREARCGPEGGGRPFSTSRGRRHIGADEKALRDSIEFSPGGYEIIDRRVEEVRLEVLTRRRDRLNSAGFKQTEISRDYEEVIGMVCERLGVPLPPLQPTDASETAAMPSSAATQLLTAGAGKALPSPRNSSFAPVPLGGPPFNPTPSQPGTPRGRTPRSSGRTPRASAFGPQAFFQVPVLVGSRPATPSRASSFRSHTPTRTTSFRAQTPSRTTSFQARSQTPSRTASFHQARSQTPTRTTSFHARSQTPSRTASFQVQGWMTPAPAWLDGQHASGSGGPVFFPNAAALVPPVTGLPPTTVWGS